MTLLQDPERHPLRPPEAARALGAVVALAPHPDDESLGCGGLLATLAAQGATPRVVVVTDGSRSHPGSHSHPPADLARLREEEAREAVRELGLGEAVTFLRLPDCAIPQPGTGLWREAAAALRETLAGADTVLVPWRRDPHCDHVDTWELARGAVREMERPPRWIEYPVWAWEHAETSAAPQDGEMQAWRLDVAGALERKGRAVAAHRSQTTRMISDTPDGFMLQPGVLAHFERPWELYLEPLAPEPPAPEARA